MKTVYIPASNGEGFKGSSAMLSPSGLKPSFSMLSSSRFICSSMPDRMCGSCLGFSACWFWRCAHRGLRRKSGYFNILLSAEIEAIMPTICPVQSTRKEQRFAKYLLCVKGAAPVHIGWQQTEKAYLLGKIQACSLYESRCLHVLCSL